MLRRAPPTSNPELMNLAYEHLQPLIAKKGSLVCWDGCVWHAGGLRKIEEGERIVMHTTFCRMYARPVENYKLSISPDIIARNPPLLATMCGLDDFLDHTYMVDQKKLSRSYRRALAGKSSALVSFWSKSKL